jgi:integrase/recombinase XerD
MTNQHELRLEVGAEVPWVLSGSGVDKFLLVNDYLGYLADRNYSPRTLRAYGYDLTGLFTFRALTEPDLRSPIPTGREARRVSAEERNGLLGHLVRPKKRSALRLREPRRLLRALNRRETADLLSSLRTWRDRSLAGLMLLSGLRSGELLTLNVTDVDIGARWIRVMGKGAKERRVPLDVEVAGLIQTYLLTERPDSTSTRLFLVAKGPNRGQPLTPAGLRTIFRYHRLKSGVYAGHPHALRHTFGTAMAEAGVDLAVMQALLGHVDTTARYIHLAPTHVKAEFDAAQTRLRART